MRQQTKKAMQHFISSKSSYLSSTTTEVVMTHICYLHLFCLSLGDPFLQTGIFQLPFCARVRFLFLIFVTFSIPPFLYKFNPFLLDVQFINRFSAHLSFHWSDKHSQFRNPLYQSNFTASYTKLPYSGRSQRGKVLLKCTVFPYKPRGSIVADGYTLKSSL